MTHEQSKAHNTIHEELLIGGFDWTFHPDETEDVGDAENGPCLHYAPAFYEYTNDRWRVITVDGAVVHRELIDPAFERWCDEQAGA